MLFQRLYTHAPARGVAQGGRFEPVESDASAVLPRVALEELDDLMKKLVPSGDGPAWAMRCFADDRDARFACVVVARQGVRDRSGREGLSTHARLVRMDGDEVDVSALIEEAPKGVLDIVRKWAALPPKDRQHTSWAVDAKPGAPVDRIWSNPEAQKAVWKSETKMKKRTERDGFAEIESLDRQHQAIYAALQDYLVRRFDAYETRVAQAPSAARASEPALWRKVAAVAAIVFITVIATLAVQRFWPREGEAPRRGHAPVPAVHVPAPAPPPPERESVAAPYVRAAAQSGKWAEQLAAFGERHPAELAVLVDIVAMSQDTKPDARRKLLAFSARLKGEGKPLGTEDRRVLRPLLFEYIANKPAGDASSMEVQSEAILRWLEENA